VTETNCGNCDWHTHINPISPRKTYCELRLDWRDIHGTCEDFTEYQLYKSDDQRRNDAKEISRKSEENRKFRWIKWGTIAGIILVILTLILIFR
jgi:hypothetical protein